METVPFAPSSGYYSVIAATMLNFKDLNVADITNIALQHSVSMLIISQHPLQLTNIHHILYI